MQRSWIVACALGCTTACRGAGSTDVSGTTDRDVPLTSVSSPSASWAAAVQAAPPMRAAPPKGRAFDLVPTLPEGSALGTRPEVTFYTPHITKGSRFEVKDLDIIVKRAAFVPTTGERVAARADEAAPQSHPEQGRYFVLTPVTPLAKGARYDLQIDEDQDIHVLAPRATHSRHEGHTVYHYRFATAQPDSSGQHVAVPIEAGSTLVAKP